MEPDIEQLPVGVTLEEFTRLYHKALERHRPAFVVTLRHLLGRTDFTSAVNGIELGVFPDETGDGHVSVWRYFTGDNPRVSRTEESLFAGKSIPLTDGLRVPLHDPSAYEFDTADASVTAVMSWVQTCWAEAGGGRYSVPAILTGHDDCCGTTEVVPLNAAAAHLHERPKRSER